MLAKKTSKNQLTLPKAVVSRFPDVDYFEVSTDGKSSLRSNRLSAAEPMRCGRTLPNSASPNRMYATPSPRARETSDRASRPARRLRHQSRNFHSCLHHGKLGLASLALARSRVCTTREFRNRCGIDRREFSHIQIPSLLGRCLELQADYLPYCRNRRSSRSMPNSLPRHQGSTIPRSGARRKGETFW